MISTYIRQGHHTLRRWALDPRVHMLARGATHGLAGLCLSAASLAGGMLPLVMGLVWACRGWRAVLVAAGGMLGYGVFWGSGSLQGILWTALALGGVLLLADRRISREQPLLIPAVGMLMVSAVGLGFQLLAGDTTSVPLYLLRVALGGAAPWVFTAWIERQTPVLEWICYGLFALGLAQIAPAAWLGLGFVAAGVAVVRCPFPCAALTGLALDLARITPVPMTAVVVLAWLVRFLPRYPRWLGMLAPGIVGLVLIQVRGYWDLQILPGLFLGGIGAGFLGGNRRAVLHRGPTGGAQVKLELASGVLDRAGQLLGDVTERFIDEDALVQRAVAEACAGCAARENCRECRKLTQWTGQILHKPLLTMEEVPVRCRKGSRVLAQLHRAQEQLRALQADRQRQREYREAVVQQYTFLSEFLQKLSDQLPRQEDGRRRLYDPLVSVYGNRDSAANGDRCMAFAGTGNQYYIVLCDGMGTGSGAVRTSRQAGELLKDLLVGGFSPSAALGSLNSFCALSDRAGIVTVDLAELDLETGKTTIYKWGAAASWLIGGEGVEKLGTATIPPGLSAETGRAVTCQLTLRRSQVLLMVSDGLAEEKIAQVCKEEAQNSCPELARSLLRRAQLEDDATVVTVQLRPISK